MVWLRVVVILAHVSPKQGLNALRHNSVPWVGQAAVTGETQRTRDGMYREQSPAVERQELRSWLEGTGGLSSDCLDSLEAARVSSELLLGWLRSDGFLRTFCPASACLSVWTYLIVLSASRRDHLPPFRLHGILLAGFYLPLTTTGVTKSWVSKRWHLPAQAFVTSLVRINGLSVFVLRSSRAGEVLQCFFFP